MRLLPALCLFLAACAGVRVDTTRVGNPVPPWEGPVRISATFPEGRTHQVAFFVAECRGACLSQLLRQLRLAVPRYGGNVGHVDRIGILLPVSVHRHVDETLSSDGAHERRTEDLAYEGIVTRLEARALFVYGEVP